MKRVILAAAMLLLLASFGFAQDAHLDVHDFAISYNGGATNTYQGCKGCHVPHGGAIAGEVVQPQRNTVFGTALVGDHTTGQNKLWDKLISSNSFQTYTSDNVAGPFMMAPGTSTDPAWHSYLCFSCHDGTTAVLNIPAGLVTGSNFLLNGGNGDIDLTNDHPVDIDWPVDLVNYEDPAVVMAGTSGFSTVSMPLYGGAANNKIECSTCHNPHLQLATSNGNRGNFLRVANVDDNTTLCRTCHVSKR